MLREQLASSHAKISTLTIQLRNARKSEFSHSGKEKDLVGLVAELAKVSSVKASARKSSELGRWGSPMKLERLPVLERELSKTVSRMKTVVMGRKGVEGEDKRVLLEELRSVQQAATNLSSYCGL